MFTIVIFTFQCTQRKLNLSEMYPIYSNTCTILAFNFFLAAESANSPEKCCVCTKAACFKTPNGEPDAICFTGANGNVKQYTNYKIAFIDLCLQNKSMPGQMWAYGKCSTPAPIIAATTSGTEPQHCEVPMHPSEPYHSYI